MDYNLIFDKAEKKFRVHLGVGDRFIFEHCLSKFSLGDEGIDKGDIYPDIKHLLIEFGYQSEEEQFRAIWEYPLAADKYLFKRLRDLQGYPIKIN